MNNFYLKDFDDVLKKFLSIFLLTMGIGIGTGLIYVYYTTSMSISGTEERFNGSITNENSDIPEEFPKPLESMILTTHDHIISFSLISFTIGIIFYFNSIISGRMKLFLLLEPFIASLITFSSMWVMRYFYSPFSIIVILSAITMYLCWYIMIFISIYELSFKK
tara:strand:- start:474 stop:965 length:492 start_codon:yes stop_codon:yes gene_type:complete